MDITELNSIKSKAFTLTEFNIIAEKIGVGNKCLVIWGRTAVESALQQNSSGDWYICQNFKDGASCEDKLGFNYSWHVGSTHELDNITDIIPYSENHTTRELLKDIKKRVTQNVIEQISKLQNSRPTELKSMLSTLESEVEVWNRAVSNNQEKIKKYTTELNSIQSKPFTLTDLKTLLKQLNKHAMIDSAYISKQGNLIVLTKNLISIDPKYNKVTDEELGRFTIRINIRGNYINVMNRDWVMDSHYPHPNIEGGSICWGHNETEVRTLQRQGDLYLLVDFIIRFFSTYPHLSDSPYIKYENWLEDRENTVNDDYIEEVLLR